MKIKKTHADSVRILFMDTVEELGSLVKKRLIDNHGLTVDNFIKAELTRFGNGEGKAILKSSVRNQRFFIVTDVGNRKLTYRAYGKEMSIMPDEHFTDLKRVISASVGNSRETNVIQTILYESRQHKRTGRESLDCAVALQEMQNMGVDCVTTFDAHNADVRQAIPLLSFDNVIPTSTMLEDFIKNENINWGKLIVLSPDEGAMGRARFYSGMLESDIGMFYKRRDYSKVDEFGKNPIAEHAYLGKEVENGQYLIVDDLISSGSSTIEILKKLKTKKADKVWVMTTFGLFTEGVKAFDKAYKEGLLTRVYCTNFTYVPEEIREKPWFYLVDGSKLLAEYLVQCINNEPITPILNGRQKMYEEIHELRENQLK